MKQPPNVSTPYTGPEVQGMVVLVVVSFVSLFSVILLLLAIALSAFNTRASPDNTLFVRTHIAAYFISLLISDFIQSIGSIINIVWIRRMGVYFGETCILQGVLKQTSHVATAVWTLVIAIHTFCLLFLELKTPPFVLWLTLLGCWSGIAAIVMFGPSTVDMAKRGPFFDASGYWCWISSNYPAHRITLDYLFMFLTAFISFVLYAIVFLHLRGNIVRDGWRISFRKRDESGTTAWPNKFSDDQALRVAKQMLFYPIAYTLLILPMAISRFASWTGSNIPFEVTIFSAAIFLLSGLVNVVLFVTMYSILPADSIKIGKWSLSRSRGPPEVSDAEQLSAQRDVGHNRSLSESTDETAVERRSDPKLSRASKPRPPSIEIMRDSIESMYSFYDDDAQEIRLDADGLHPPTPTPPVLTSRWSPDGSPTPPRRSWRFTGGGIFR